jgi:hypothetical protein
MIRKDTLQTNELNKTLYLSQCCKRNYSTPCVFRKCIDANFAPAKLQYLFSDNE